MTSADSAVSQSDILDRYYADNAKKLHQTVERTLCRFGGISGRDKDDFYSLANEVLADAVRRYDHERSFDGFLYSCLSNRIKTEMTRRNREKRRADRLCISLDAADGEGEECSLLEFIPSDFDTFEEAVKSQGNGRYQDKVQQYVSRLSDRQVNILNLLIDGYRPGEIQLILEISSKEYADDMSIMRSYENVKILF